MGPQRLHRGRTGTEGRSSDSELPTPTRSLSPQDPSRTLYRTSASKRWFSVSGQSFPPPWNLCAAGWELSELSWLSELSCSCL